MHDLLLSYTLGHLYQTRKKRIVGVYIPFLTQAITV